MSAMTNITCANCTWKGRRPHPPKNTGCQHANWIGMQMCSHGRPFTWLQCSAQGERLGSHLPIRRGSQLEAHCLACQVPVLLRIRRKSGPHEEDIARDTCSTDETEPFTCVVRLHHALQVIPRGHRSDGSLASVLFFAKATTHRHGTTLHPLAECAHPAAKLPM